jgi:hypothetical protein
MAPTRTPGTIVRSCAARGVPQAPAALRAAVHLNAVTRFKLALTEPNPTIRPYDEARWAELGDVPGTPVEVSLRLLEALHERWVVLLRSLSVADFGRTLFHPERGATMTLDELLALYAWHGRHHTAHITGLRERAGWDRG